MKRLILLFLTIAVSVSSKAQIQHTIVNPTRVIKGTGASNMLDSIKLHLAHPIGTVLGKDSALHIWHFDPAAPGSNDVGADCRGMLVELLELASSPAPGAAAIDSGKMIDASAGKWDRPNYVRLAIEGAADNWDNQSDKYLGVRFKRGADWYYGWVKMTIDGLPTMVEVKSYAYEKKANTGIIAGKLGTASGGTGITLTQAPELQLQVDNKVVTFYNTKETASISIIDMNGKVVHATGLSAQNTTVNLQHLPSGMYVAWVSVEGYTTSAKLAL